MDEIPSLALKSVLCTQNKPKEHNQKLFASCIVSRAFYCPLCLTITSRNLSMLIFARLKKLLSIAHYTKMKTSTFLTIPSVVIDAHLFRCMQIWRKCFWVRRTPSVDTGGFQSTGNSPPLSRRRVASMTFSTFSPILAAPRWIWFILSSKHQGTGWDPDSGNAFSVKGFRRQNKSCSCENGIIIFFAGS